MRGRKINLYRSAEKSLFKTYGVQPEEHFIEVKEFGVNIRALTIGSGSSLLFIHGGPAAGSLWMPLIEHLNGYKCIIIDRPGCGLSEKVSYKDLSRIRLQSIITAVIDSVLAYFRVGNLPVIASSFGSYLVMLYLMKKKSTISKLVFEGCPAMVEGCHVPGFMKPMLLPVLRWVIPRLPATKPIFHKIIRGLGHSFSLDHNLINEDFIKWYISLFNYTNTQVNEISMITKAVPGGKLNPEFMLNDEEIETISQPLLFLWAKNDPFGGVDIGQRLVDKNENFSLRQFENSGHLPWLDKPADHANEIRKFCN